MKRLIGYLLVVALTAFPIIAVVFFIAALHTLANASIIHCPMPADCNTTATMNTWYACKARQFRLGNPVAQQKSCIAHLTGMGATQEFAIKACVE